MTGHEAAGKYRPQVDWEAIAKGSETIVIYMGIHNLPNITARLQEGGLSPQTPVLLIRWGTRPEQEELAGTLANIVEKVASTGFSAPAIAIVGNVIEFREGMRSTETLSKIPQIFSLPITD